MQITCFDTGPLGPYPSFSLFLFQRQKKNFLTFQQSLCRLINLLLNTFSNTLEHTVFRSSLSSSTTTINFSTFPLNHRPFKWTLFKNHQAAINKYFSNDWFSSVFGSREIQRLKYIHSDGQRQKQLSFKFYLKVFTLIVTKFGRRFKAQKLSL